MVDRIYTIEMQRQRTSVVNGVLTDVYEVHYAGPNGITGYVLVPVRTATPDAVDELIRRQLAGQLEIAALGTQ